MIRFSKLREMSFKSELWKAQKDVNYQVKVRIQTEFICRKEGLIKQNEERYKNDWKINKFVFVRQLNFYVEFAYQIFQ